MNKGNSSLKLSNVARRYLDAYSVILNSMIRCMTGARLTDSISGNFIRQMIPHHRAAIDMSLNILRYTTNIEVQNIALGIIAEQTKSIDDMVSVETCCNAKQNAPIQLRPYTRAYNEITKTMFSEMKAAPQTNSVNYNFLSEMIPHHRGAVRMGENALKYSICGELQPIIDSIIRSQKKGIEQMQALLKQAPVCSGWGTPHGEDA